MRPFLRRCCKHTLAIGANASHGSDSCLFLEIRKNEIESIAKNRMAKKINIPTRHLPRRKDNPRTCQGRLARP